jgi:hypothetical protein
MFFLISNDVILSQGQANSFAAFKKRFPIPASLDIVGIVNEYVEIPDDILSGITGYTSFTGDSGGMGGTHGSPDISGITYSESFIRGDFGERIDVLGIDLDPGFTGLNDGLFAFSDTAVSNAAILFENEDDNETNFITFDPRLSPTITLSQLQAIKIAESNNAFIEDGLGLTTTVEWTTDEGTTDSAVMGTGYDAMTDIMMVQEYSRLNQSIVN